MNEQNLFLPFSDNPIDAWKKQVKSNLFMHIITAVRKRGWSQAEAARQLDLSAPRINNLFKGHLEKFSIDMLMTMSMTLGYVIGASFDPENEEQPLVITMRKGML